MAQRVESFVLKGGLDRETPAINRKPGTLITCSNYEPSTEGGYSRILGFERYDGKPSPSDAQFNILYFTNGITEITAGDSISGNTSSATGTVLAVEVQSGSWLNNDAVGYIVMTKVTGTWVVDETILVSAVARAVTTSIATTVATLDNSVDLQEQYTILAQDEYRSDIAEVPGTNRLRGVWILGETVYAFRDNEGETACIMYKEDSVVGWTTIDLGGSISFDTGSTEQPAIGSTITQAVSGASAVVIGVVYTGSWASLNATGRIHVRAITGTFDETNILSWTGNAGTAVATGAVVNAFSTGGTFEFTTYNFGTTSSEKAMYGCNGIDPAFEFDGTNFMFIYVTEDENLASVNNAPSHVYAHKNQLFLSNDARIVHSSIGLPLNFYVVDGAGYLSTGDEVTGFSSVPGGDLAIFTRNSTSILKGSASVGSDIWKMETLSGEAGAIEWTIQNMGDTPKYLDDRGIMGLDTTDQYGDFRKASLSTIVDSIVQTKRSITTTSSRIRTKDQYRVYFSDNIVVVMQLISRSRYGNKYEFSIINYGMPIYHMQSVEDSTGLERHFGSSDSGYVYEFEKGHSFDGEDINYQLRLSFNNLKSPRNKKRFFRAVIDVDNQEVPDLNFVAEFSYGNIDRALGRERDATLNITPGGGYLDSLDQYQSFNWDGQHIGQANADLDGSGLNMSLLVTGSSKYQKEHKLHGVSLHYGLRGLKR